MAINEDKKLQILLIVVVILSMLAGSLGTIAYDNHRLNKYTENVLLNAQEIISACKNNYFQDYRIREGKNSYIFEFVDNTNISEVENETK